MRYVFGFLGVFTLSLMLSVGCNEAGGEGGSGGTAGTGGTAGSGGMAGSGGSAGSGGTGGMPECQITDDCDDNDACTRDACDDQTCSYFPADCDDRNDCTTEACEAADGCTTPTPVANGTPCAGGTCQSGVCELAGSMLPCTEQGIRNAIAAGDGPYTFDCDGPQTVVTEAEIVIDNDVILDGEGNLIVDGNSSAYPQGEQHLVFVVPSDVAAELRQMTVTGGPCDAAPLCQPFECFDCDDAIEVDGTLTVTDCTVSGNEGGGIGGSGTVTVMNSTASGNESQGFGGYTLTVMNSTASGNQVGIELAFSGTLTVMNSTVSGNSSYGIDADGVWSVTNSTVSGNEVGIAGDGVGTINNSTLTRNTNGGIWNQGALTVLNSTLSDNGIDIGEFGATLTLINSTVLTTGDAIQGSCGNGRFESRASVIQGDCGYPVCSIYPTWISLGYNIESPNNTCRFDQATDQVKVTAEQLNLGPLAGNGGPTMTHALLPGSVAIDKIPEADCEVTTDQRGVARPQGDACDVGAFELEVAP